MLLKNLFKKIHVPHLNWWRRTQYKRYLFSTLNLKAGLPIAWQHMFSRRQIYLFLADPSLAATYLSQQHFSRLDNPKRFACHFWERKKQMIILCDPKASKALNTLLTYLNRMVKYNQLCGICYLVDSKQLLQHKKLQRIKSYWQIIQAAINTHHVLNKNALKLVVFNLHHLVGMNEHKQLPINQERFWLNTPEHIRQTLQDQIIQYLHQHNTTLDHARLFLLQDQITLLIKKIEGFKALKPSQSQLLASVPNLFDHYLKQLAEETANKRHGHLPLFIKGILTMGLLTLFTITGLRFYSCHLYMKQASQEARTAIKQDDTDINFKSLLIHNKQRYGLFSNQIPSYFPGWIFHLQVKIQDLTKSLFERELQLSYLPILQNNLYKLLQINKYNPKERYQALASYLMLTYPTHFNAHFIFTWLQKNNHVLMNPLLLSHQDEKILRFLQQNSFYALPYHVKHIQDLKHHLPALSMQLTRQLKQIATYFPAYTLPMKNIFVKHLAQYSIPPSQMSQFYTRTGYQWLMKHLHCILNTDWLYQHTTTPVGIRKMLLTTYRQQYIQHWQYIITHLKLRPSANLRAATQLAKLAMQPKSFWIQWFQAIKYNTDLGTHTNTTRNITKTFSLFNKTVSNKKILKKYSKIFAGIYHYLKHFHANKRLAFITLKQAIQQHKTISVFNEMNKIKIPCRYTENLITTAIQKSILAGLFNNANQQIQSIWQNKVIPALILAMRQYPFDITSPNDISEHTLLMLFGYKGVVSNFIHQDITPFLSLSHQQLESFYCLTLPISHKAENTFKLLWLIHHDLFIKHGKILRIKFFLMPTYLSSQIASSKLQLLNQTIFYEHGPAVLKKIQWPSPIPNFTATLSWDTRYHQSHVLTQKDLWAWLRMLQIAQSHATTQQNIWTLDFQLSQGIMQYKLITSSAMNIILQGDLQRLGSIVRGTYNANH